MTDECRVKVSNKEWHLKDVASNIIFELLATFGRDPESAAEQTLPF